MSFSSLNRCLAVVSMLLGVITMSINTAGAALSADINQEEAKNIAKDAYIYAFPMVDAYRILYSYFVDTKNPEFKAGFNQIKSIARVFTPDDKAVQTPNSDTPYSMVGLDLRAEPMVLTLPAIDEKRYFSVQLIDLYTHNFAYLGSRTTGNAGGNYLIAGPNWNGTKPEGIKEVIKSETELVLGVYRTQLFNPADLDNVKKIQKGYELKPLSQFEGKASPKSAPAIEFIKPVTLSEDSHSLEVFSVLNFLLEFCPVVESEKDLMTRFAKAGIAPGAKFDSDNLPKEIRGAMESGIEEAWQTYENFKHNEIDKGKVTSGDIFGTREYLKNNYLYRMAAAKLGIFGNSKMEAMYPIFATDVDGEKLDASKHKYAIRFEKGDLPPVKAFWSLTMYELPSSLLVGNALNRYLINSPMLPDLKLADDGSLTLYMQQEKPQDTDRIANWLPAPDGPFMAVLRLYWPEETATSGQWKVPALKKVD